MPAAATDLCVQCTTQPSKYTCPTCKARTCSLACTRAHKSADSAPNGCSVVVPGSSASRAIPAEAASTSHHHHPASTATSSSGSGGYIPLKQYDESHMLQDYLFLSSISRTTAETGRRIMAMNLLPPTASSDPKNQHATAGGAGGGGVRLTNAQRHRDQLLKQLHYRKFKVMVLPEGMARRKANLSQFQPKDKTFVLSVELKLPHHPAAAAAAAVAAKGKGKANGMGWMVHKQDCLQSVEQVVLNELQSRSFANKKELVRLKSAFSSPTWIVSTTLIAESHLPLPRDSTRIDPAKQKEGDASMVALDAWPREWAVLVPAYSARLTNESTTRYLDWWNRKRKWEEANPGLAAMQKEAQLNGDDRVDFGERRERRDRDGGWDRRTRERREEQDVGGTNKRRPSQQEADGLEQPREVVDVEQSAALAGKSLDPASAPAATTQGLISSSLLSMLSQRLGRQTAPTSTASASAPPPSPPRDPSPSPPSPPSPRLPTTATPATSATSAIESDPARSILAHITSPHHTTLAWLLQTLPDGYSVVEFPEIRIVAVEEVEHMRRKEAGAVQVVALHGEDARTAVGEDKQAEVARKLRGESTVTQPTSGSLGSLAGLLAGYASESDSEGQDEQQPEPQPDHAVVGAETETLADKAVEGQVREQVESEATLASLARQHGFTAAPTTSI